MNAIEDYACFKKNGLQANFECITVVYMYEIAGIYPNTLTNVRFLEED